jgi:hypothetical protein
MSHPNAATAAGLTGPSVLVVWLLSRLGIVDVSPEVAVVMGGAVISIGLLVGKRGIKGMLSMLWKGDG